MTAGQRVDGSAIQEKIQRVLEDPSFAPFRAPDPDQTLSAIQASSMDLVLFSVAIERAFGIRFSLDEMASEAFASRAALASLVQKKLERG